MIIITALLITFSVAGIGWLFFPIGDLIINTTIKRAIRKYIIPYLGSKGFSYIEYKFDSLNRSVNFKDENSKPKFYLLMTNLRSANLPIYIMVKYQCGDEIKKVTARIDTTCFFIRSVNYNNEL